MRRIEAHPTLGIRRQSELDHALLSCDKTQRRKVDPGAAFPYESILDRVLQAQYERRGA
jgi:hypothetical protein